jgi:hypothetical protein
MRFYHLTISNATTGMVYQPTANGNSFTQAKGGSTFSSQINGVNNPGALQIDFDIPVYNFNQPQGNSKIKVWGVGLGMISQAAQLAGANFTLSGGMAKGLPLATVQSVQAGILAQGSIFQGYGNWEGTDQTLDLIVNPGALNTNQKIVFNWPVGVPLASALAGTLNQAFPAPTYKQKLSVGNLVLSNSQPAFYDTFWQFAAALTGITQQAGQAVFGPSYPGVQITIIGNTIFAYDGTVATTPKMLAFQDLIGQPTWVDPSTVNFKTVLRSDIAVGSTIVFPQGVQAPFALTSSTAAVPGAPASSKTAFQGTFVISEVHHFASSRQSDAASWATAFSAVSAPALSNT